MNFSFRSTVLALAAVTNFAMADESVVLREPYTLRLHQDKTHYVEYPVGKVPFVHNGSVYLFKDDYFGVNLDVQNDAVAAVSKGPVGTSIIPVQAGLVNFESWPHPIAQLVLTKLAVK
ncbi:hypothetical protein [Duganella sp. HH101]|uniref:hypothetical protein n=1 Tax=Duganella sp. HH101 TaxID=1781066 RepID=UPI00089418EF|nr:hypothetical protein [Duganella sp. HH101]OFA04178.1 hypothetical protein DUGA2_24490 [Duganella sp. HH101]